MTTPTPPGILDFFVLEASEYVDQLDALLQRGGTRGPDADALQRVARALRGSASMSKLPSFSDVAAGIERVARALREGGLSWNVALSGALVSAIDDCKIFLRNVRRGAKRTKCAHARAPRNSPDMHQCMAPRPRRHPRPSVTTRTWRRKRRISARAWSSSRPALPTRTPRRTCCVACAHCAALPA